jgi:hypothetical protein
MCPNFWQKSRALDPDDAPLDMVYAYYVGMGGFAAEFQDLHNTLDRVTITSYGVLYMARHGYLCKVKKCDIEDKSKANKFAKGLVCVQVAWVIGQAIERRTAGFPITLLEIHTIVHAVCALLMYGLWFKKPFDINAPTILDFGEHRDLLAFILQTPSRHDFSNILNDGPSWEPFWRRNGVYAIVLPDIVWQGNFEPFEKEIEHVKDRPYELSSINKSVETPIPIRTLCNFFSHDADGKKNQYPMGKVSLDSEDTQSRECKTACVLFPGQTLKNGLGPPIPRSWYSGSSVEKDSEIPIRSVLLSEKDLKRLDLVRVFLERIAFRWDANSRIWDFGPPYFSDMYIGQQLSDFCHECWNAPITSRAENFSLSIISPTGVRIWCQAALGVIPLAYGGVHVAAWRMVFPTTVERSLWRYSCFYLLASSIALAIKIFCMCFDSAVSSAAYRRTGLMKIDERYVKDPDFDLGPTPKSPIKYLGYLLAKRDVRIRLEAGKWPSTMTTTELWSITKFYMNENILRPLLGEKLELSQDILRWIRLGIKACIGIVYLAARIYLVAESFLSLRHVPIGVYQTPDLNIMGLIPHI